MYYRMSTYKIYPGKEDEFLAIADRVRPEMKAIPGIVHIHGVKLAEDNYMTVAVYESAERAEAATETAKTIWARLAECIDLDSINQQTGEVTWEL
jgi:heme-degrading monooxygenase HmoA